LPSGLRIYSRWRNRGGAGLFRPDVIAYPFPEWVEESEYRGHDGLRALIALWKDNFDAFEIHEDEFRDGLIGETRNFLTWRKALDTVGLSE
jgi:hypothetical protein